MATRSKADTRIESSASSCDAVNAFVPMERGEQPDDSALVRELTGND